MSVGERVALTMVIVLIILFALALFGWSTGRWDEALAAPVKQDCIDQELQDQIRKMTLQALDLAFQDRVELLYGNWSKEDPWKHPDRAQVGMDHAIHTYVYARGLANKWSAPTCPPKPVGVN